MINYSYLIDAYFNIRFSIHWIEHFDNDDWLIWYFVQIDWLILT